MEAEPGMRLTGSSERRRVAVCAAAGILVDAALLTIAPWQLAVLGGWLTSAALLLAWIWFEIGALDASATALVATREDDSRAAARYVLLASSVMSLFAVVAALHRASTADSELAVTLTAASLVAVVLAWFVVNTMFVLRYSHLYYAGSAAGGVEFPGDTAPFEGRLECAGSGHRFLLGRIDCASCPTRHDSPRPGRHLSRCSGRRSSRDGY